MSTSALMVLRRAAPRGCGAFLFLPPRSCYNKGRPLLIRTRSLSAPKATLCTATASLDFFRTTDFGQTQSKRRSTSIRRHDTTTEEDTYAVCCDPLDECWSATSFSINPSDESHINKVLQALNSPAPQSFYVLQRALSLAPTWKAAFDACSYLVKFNYQIVVRHDLDPSEPCRTVGVDWKAIPISSSSPESGWTVVTRPSRPQNTIQWVSDALALVEEASQRQEEPVNDNQVEQIIQSARENLFLTLGTDIRGRTSADTAFALALAGVTDTALFHVLSKITRLELERVGSRPSRRGKDILHIVEKLAASGIRGEEAERAYRVAAKCLAEKGPHVIARDDLALPGRFNLLSDRPLIWLWRYSSRLPKPKAKIVVESNSAVAQVAPPEEWWNGYKDCSKPLVVDLGCGLGVSLLGLTSLSLNDTERTSQLLDGTRWSDCNFLGCDLNQLTIRFARGISTRWDLTDRLQYVICSTEALLDQLCCQYPGQVKLILVQYPSPYKFDEDQDDYMCNSQLPGNVESGFMISTFVMNQIAKILQSSHGAKVLFQSNCEDVSITMRDMAVKAGLRCINAANPVESLHNSTWLPQRTEKWIQQGGERPVGPHWWADSILPDHCATETEVACGLKETPVHRFLAEATPVSNQ